MTGSVRTILILALALSTYALIGLLGPNSQRACAIQTRGGSSHRPIELTLKDAVNNSAEMHDFLEQLGQFDAKFKSASSLPDEKKRAAKINELMRTQTSLCVQFHSRVEKELEDAAGRRLLLIAGLSQASKRKAIWADIVKRFPGTWAAKKADFRIKHPLKGQKTDGQ